MQKVVVIDNYDSFTYNIIHIVEKLLGQDVSVFRNDEVNIQTISSFDNIIISPGPGLPNEAGITMEVIRTFCTSKKILGVCLGHQAIAESFGANLRNLTKVFHGVSSPVKISDDNLFAGLPGIIDVGRYHSWVIDPLTLPDQLEPIAYDNEGNIMAISHKRYRVKGIQFHPESVLTKYGEQILQNWLV